MMEDRGSGVRLRGSGGTLSDRALSRELLIERYVCPCGHRSPSRFASIVGCSRCGFKVAHCVDCPLKWVGGCTVCPPRQAFVELLQVRMGKLICRS
jgi:hypothetical protein